MDFAGMRVRALNPGTRSPSPPFGMEDRDGERMRAGPWKGPAKAGRPGGRDAAGSLNRLSDEPAGSGSFIILIACGWTRLNVHMGAPGVKFLYFPRVIRWLR